MPPEERIRICCVEDEWAIAELLRMTVATEPDMEPLGFVPSIDELEQLLKTHQADVVVVDLTLPGREPLGFIREQSSNGGPKFVVYSGYDDGETIKRVEAAGASGFVSKRHDVETLLACIRSVAAGERVVRS